MNPENYVITVGRQLGSGGDDMAKALAKHFGFQHVNKAILMKSAEILQIPVDHIENLDEKNYSVWDAFLQSHIYDLAYIPDGWGMLTGRKLFETQSEILFQAANESSCVIVGRCSNYLFRNHPKRISIFLHAGLENRIQRMEGVYGLAGEQVRKTVLKNDKDRDRYYNTYTGQKRLDLSNYDICLDTGIMPEDQVKEILIEAICARFPELKEE